MTVYYLMSCVVIFKNFHLILERTQNERNKEMKILTPSDIGYLQFACKCLIHLQFYSLFVTRSSYNLIAGFCRS